jgi:Fic family protein
MGGVTAHKVSLPRSSAADVDRVGVTVNNDTEKDMPRGQYTVEQLRKLIMKNVAKREGRTGAEIAERLGLENARQINRALGTLRLDGSIERDTSRPPKYRKAA